jgi:hypothetical protein
MDYPTLVRLLGSLEEAGVRYAIFGAVALNLHGLARFTEDVDLFVAPDRDNITRLKRALFATFGDAEIHTIDPDDLLGPYPAIQYVPPSGGFHVDILTRLGEAFGFADLETERLPFDGLTVTVVTPRTLYRMKKDTVRLKDKADADALRRLFGLESD